MNAPMLEKLAVRWRRILCARELLFSVAPGALCWALLDAAGFKWIGASSLLVAVIVLAFRLRRIRPEQVSARAIALHWNRTFPELEESAMLLLTDPQRDSVVEKLQRRRLDAAVARLFGEPTRARPLPPARWSWPLGSILGAMVCLGIAATQTRSPSPPPGATSETHPVSKKALQVARAGSPRIRRAEVQIFPPAYTALPSRVGGLDDEVLEGSRVSWRIWMEGVVSELRFVSDDDKATSIFHAEAPEIVTVEKIVGQSMLYQLGWKRADGTSGTLPEIHALRVRRDAPPTVQLLDLPNNRIELASLDERLPIAARVADDFGVREVHLVITVSRGAGESVKFREQILPMQQAAAGPLHGSYGTEIDTSQFSLESGDEFYFYVAATDNREPEPNHARSETRFVTVRGPTPARMSEAIAARGVNLVPEYFRSQRQVIIDTEKLLADAVQISTEVFRHRSEQIGIDEKLLRLRYGKFLGEESETEASARPDTPIPVGGSLGAVVGEMRRKTSASRAGENSERLLELAHSAVLANPTRETPPTAAEVLAPYVDQHDKADEATFFNGAENKSLREILAALWDAEGLLRVGKPRDALVPENQALALLKALQESDRAYVQHVGFEPPPLRVEQRRLQGELEAIPAAANEAIPSDVENPDNIVLRNLLARASASSFWNLENATDKDAATRLEKIIAQAVQEKPGLLPTLQQLRIARADGRIDPVTAAMLTRAAWLLLPSGLARPAASELPDPALNSGFLRALQTEQPQ